MADYVTVEVPGDVLGRLNVLIDVPIPARLIEDMSRDVPEVTFLYGKTAENLRAADVIFTNQADFDPAAAPNLRWVQLNTAAAGHISGRPVARSGQISVATVGGAYAIAVAEHSMALALALMRHLPKLFDLQQQATWPEDPMPLRGGNCYGKTVGLLGYGSIGRHIAKLSAAFGMNVLACKRQPDSHGSSAFRPGDIGDPDGDLPTGWFGLDQLPEMLAQTDILMVSLPGTGQTRNILNRAMLGRLPRHANLISVGRGDVLDEGALCDALDSGELAGAALDVFQSEPLPPDSRLWNTPNLILTPHIASFTDEQQGMAVKALLANIEVHRAGSPLRNVVDFDLGY